MCSISGFITFGKDKIGFREETIKTILGRAKDRGRDSFGIGYYDGMGGPKFIHTLDKDFPANIDINKKVKILINNNRAEPTTEFVLEKTTKDVQPFKFESLCAHNGTIANDKEFKNKCHPTIDSGILAPLFKGTHSLEAFKEKLSKVIGSYAIAFSEGHNLFLATNYKPLILARLGETYYFTSVKSYLPKYMDEVIEVEPYTAMLIDLNGNIEKVSLYEKEINDRAIIVCSGGLDSTVVAKYAQVIDKKEITLLHYLYNCNAQEQEVERIKQISKALNCSYVLIDLDLKKMIGGSPLFDSKGVAKGIEGAEFAHEWVPARNLIMLSIAIGYAESKNYNTVYLGNNLEEAGAYPDNEMIFIDKLQQVIPYAIQNQKRVELKMPVGNMVKHEIVKLGLEIDAPMDKTWSCYYNGKVHCGNCGPCFMRKTAYEINNKSDPVFSVM